MLEHCYATVAARTERLSKRKRGHKYTLCCVLAVPTGNLVCWFVIAGDRLTISCLVISSTDNILVVPVTPEVRPEIVQVHTGSIRNTEPPSTASTGEYP